MPYGSGIPMVQNPQALASILFLSTFLILKMLETKIFRAFPLPDMLSWESREPVCGALMPPSEGPEHISASHWLPAPLWRDTHTKAEVNKGCHPGHLQRRIQKLYSSLTLRCWRAEVAAMPRIPAPRRQKQVHACKFKASLVFESTFQASHSETLTAPSPTKKSKNQNWNKKMGDGGGKYHTEDYLFI